RHRFHVGSHTAGQYHTESSICQNTLLYMWHADGLLHSPGCVLLPLLLTVLSFSNQFHFHRKYNHLNRCRQQRERRVQSLFPSHRWKHYPISKRQPFYQRVYHLLPLAFLGQNSTRLNSSHVSISYTVFCLNKKSH